MGENIDACTEAAILDTKGRLVVGAAVWPQSEEVNRLVIAVGGMKETLDRGVAAHRGKFGVGLQRLVLLGGIAGVDVEAELMAVQPVLVSESAHETGAGES